MQPLYIVYTENQNQQKYLQAEFLQKSSHFAVPLSQASMLKELVQKTCYEFYDKDVSIFIEKLKNLIVGLIEFNFSFPLWREILFTLKRKDLMAERYRKYVIEFDNLFVGNDAVVTQMQISQKKSPDSVDDEFQKALNSFKTLELTNIEDILTMGSTSLGNFVQKPSNHQSQKTNDRSLNKNVKKPLEITYGRQQEVRFKSIDQITAIKNMQQRFEQQLTKHSENAKNNISNNYGPSDQFEKFMNSSFKKQKSSPIAQMIINDQSLRNVAKKQKKKQKDMNKLQDELYQKTKTIKSKEYNKNIKTILMNHKIRDRRKAGFEGQKSTISGVIGAYELRKVSSSEFLRFDDEDNLKLFKSAGKPHIKLDKP